MECLPSALRRPIICCGPEILCLAILLALVIAIFHGIDETTCSSLYIEGESRSLACYEDQISSCRLLILVRCEGSVSWRGWRRVRYSDGRQAEEINRRASDEAWHLFHCDSGHPKRGGPLYLLFRPISSQSRNPCNHRISSALFKPSKTPCILNPIYFSISLVTEIGCSGTSQPCEHFPSPIFALYTMHISGFRNLSRHHK